jgi:hypothetical protein
MVETKTMDSKLKLHLVALLGEITAEIAEDTREISVRETRIEKNKALLAHVRSSLGAYKDGPGQTDREYVLAAIEKLPIGAFTVDDVLREAKQFPEAVLTTRTVGTHLYRMLSRNNTNAFRQVSKGGGRNPATYEKLPPPIRNRTRAADEQSSELIPTNGATAGHFK